MTPQGQDNIKIEAVVENINRFQYDNITPPEIVYPELDPIVDLPLATNIFAYKDATNMVVTWDAAIDPTAVDYVICISMDNVNFTDLRTTTGLTTTFVSPTYIDAGVYIKITATNLDGAGDEVIYFSIPEVLPPS